MPESSSAADFPRVDTFASISTDANPPSPSMRETSTMDLLAASAPPGRAASITSASTASLADHDSSSQPQGHRRTISLNPSLKSLGKPPESQSGGTALSPIPSTSPGNSIAPATPVDAPKPTAANTAALPKMDKPSKADEFKKTSSNFIVRHPS